MNFDLECNVISTATYLFGFALKESASNELLGPTRCAHHSRGAGAISQLLRDGSSSNDLT